MDVFDFERQQQRGTNSQTDADRCITSGMIICAFSKTNRAGMLSRCEAFEWSYVRNIIQYKLVKSEHGSLTDRKQCAIFCQ